MNIQSIPMLQRDKRAYQLYISKMNKELESTFVMSENSEERRLVIKAEIEVSEDRITAIDNELRAIPQSEMKKA